MVKRYHFAALSITTCILAGIGFVASTPSSAADLPMVIATCSKTGTSSSTQTVSGYVGDRFYLVNSVEGATSGNKVCNVTSSGPNGSGGLGGTMNPGTGSFYNLNVVGLSTLTLTGELGYVLTIDVTVAAVPDPAPASQESAPARYLQQVPIPASGSCNGVQDAALAWGTGVTGGWSRAWGDWANAWVCSRVITNAGGTWHVIDA